MIWTDEFSVKYFKRVYIWLNVDSSTRLDNLQRWFTITLLTFNINSVVCRLYLSVLNNNHRNSKPSVHLRLVNKAKPNYSNLPSRCLKIAHFVSKYLNKWQHQIHIHIAESIQSVFRLQDYSSPNKTTLMTN